VLKILRSAPAKYQQMVVAICTLIDVSTLSVVEMTGQLKASEDLFDDAPAALHHDGRLYMMAEEWELRRKKRRWRIFRRWREREFRRPWRRAFTRPRTWTRRRWVVVLRAGQQLRQACRPGRMSPVWGKWALGP
jgi:hypothetical protein